METPTSRMGSRRLWLAGTYHVTAVQQTPELEPMAGAIVPIMDELRGHAKAREDAEDALVPMRVRLVFLERAAERALRVTANSASTLDGKRGGAVHSALFPDGLATETRPKAQRQVDALERVINRLTTSTLAEPLRAEHLPKLTAAKAALEAGLLARKTGVVAVGAAMAAELSTREDFVRAYDGNAGAIREHFPKDRESQELYFDAINVRGTALDDEDQVVI